MEVTNADNKDGLRELIEMRNKRTKESSAAAAPATGSASATKANYWSTMKALYDQKQNKFSADFGPFSANNSNSPTDNLDEPGGGGGEGGHSPVGIDDDIDVGSKLTGLNGSGDHNGSALMSRLRARSNSCDDDKPVTSSHSKPSVLETPGDGEVKNERCSSEGDNLEDSEARERDVVPSGDTDPIQDEEHGWSEDDRDLAHDNLPENSDLSHEQGEASSHDNDQDNETIDDGKDELDDVEELDEEADQTPDDKQQMVPPKEEQPFDPNVWTLPIDKNDCTLDEIRRGQFINKTAHNECPVLGCGKLINDARLDPNPGTISAGLKTHVLFVHYHSRRVSKKRKLNWSRKRPGQPSPKKPMSIGSASSAVRPTSSMHINDFADFERQPNSSLPNLTNAGLGFARPQPARKSVQILNPGPTSLINRNRPTVSLNNVNRQQQSSQAYPMSSLQSLIQATGGPQLSPHAQQQQQMQQLNLHNQQSQQNQQQPQQQQPQAHQRNDEFQKTINQTTSSLFSILTSLTQQPSSQQQPSVSRIAKTAAGTNTINVSQCSSRNNNNGLSSRQASSSLLSLLNEKITTGNVSSLQAQLKKGNGNDQRNKLITTSRRQNVSPPTTSAFLQSAHGNTSLSNLSSLTNDPNFNGSASILNGLCSGNGISRVNDGRLNSSSDSVSSLSSFIRSIAVKTNSNIGPNGLGEVKRIIEKFTTSLLCSSQTIADHHVAPFAGEPPQQKPEISPSDVMLAYKMMQRTQL